MTCAEIAPLLAESAVGFETDEDEPVLAPDEATRLDAHLRACAPCREAQGGLARAHRRLAEPAGVALDAGLRARTLTAVLETLAHDVPAPEKKAPAEPAPALDPTRLDAIGRSIALACSYCRDRTGRDAAVFCASCLAPHHRECFEAHGRCSLPGCEETRTVRPQDAPQAAPRRRRWVAFALVPLVAGGSIAALRAARREWTEDGLAALKAPLAPPTPAATERPAPPEPTLDPWAPPPAASPSAPRPLVSVRADGRPVRDVLAEVASASSANVLVDPAVDGDAAVTVSLVGATWRDAVAAVARAARCDVEELPGEVLVVHQTPRVSLQLEDAPIRTALQLLAAYAGRSVVVAPDVTGSVSASFEDTPWDRALLTVARARGLHLALAGRDAVLVTTRRLDPARAATLPPAGLVTRAARAADRGPDPRVELDLADADLAEAMEALGRRAGVQVVVDAAVQERVTARLRDLPLEHALGAIARLTRCVAEERAGGRWVLTQPPRVTLQAADCPLPRWFQLLGQAGGFSLAMDQVRGGITLDVKELGVRDAALVTAAAAGATATFEGGALTLRGPTLVGPAPQQLQPNDPRLEELADSIVQLVRAADRARTRDERDRLATALEAKQAELRGRLAPSAPALEPAREAAPGVALADPDGAGALLAKTPDEQRALFDALDALRASAPGDPRLAAWEAHLAALGAAGAGIELQARVAQGNDLLKDMAAAGRDERWADVLAASRRADALVALLKARGGELFLANADALATRAEALARRARTLEEIQALELRVQAILVDEGSARALAVIEDQVVGVGDAVAPGGEPPSDDAPRVVSIGRNAVRLVVRGTEFVRELGR